MNFLIIVLEKNFRNYTAFRICVVIPTFRAVFERKAEFFCLFFGSQVAVLLYGFGKKSPCLTTRAYV